METVFDRNIRFISKNFPALRKKILTSGGPAEDSGVYSYRSSPKPNILFNKKPFHSVVDPDKEALNLVRDMTLKEGSLILFFGIGVGYHIEKFKELYGDKTNRASILIIEKSSEAFSLLVRNKDISFLKNTRLFIGESTADVKAFFNTLDPLAFKGYRIVRLRGNFTSFENYYSEIEKHFKKVMSGKLSDMLTRFAFEGLWIKNIIDNIPFLTNKQSITAMRDTLKNKPVLVINAGPSLFYQLELIKEISRKVHTIAVDTALEPLLLSGIEPDFVITLDAQFHNLLDFRYPFTGRNNLLTGSNLIADVVVYPQILKNWQGNLYFSQTEVATDQDGRKRTRGHPLTHLLNGYFPHIQSLKCGGSVSTTAIEFACHTGAYPVLLTGLDLSYTQFATHVNSSPHYNEFYARTDRFNSLQNFMVSSISRRKLQYLPGTGKEDVLSDFIFSNYLRWIGSRKEYRNRVYNITEMGARIPGLHLLSLEKLIKNNVFTTIKSPVKPERSVYLTRNESLQFLTDLKERVRGARKELPGNRASISSFIKKYVFLRNNVLEAQALHPDLSSMNQHLALLLQFIEKHITRSIIKLTAGDSTSHSIFRTSYTPPSI